MDIEKNMLNTKIKYFNGQNCFSLETTDLKHIFDTTNKIYFVVSGKCAFTFEEAEPPFNSSYVLSAGEMMVIPAGIHHSIYLKYDASDTCHDLWVSFQFDCDGKNIFDMFSFPFIIKPKDPQKAENLMMTVIDLGRHNSLISLYRQNAAIIELVTYFLEESGASPCEPKIQSMESILQYIDNNLNHDFSLEELAAMAHIHPVHFIRQFKKLTGTTPMQYIRSKRMYYAWSKISNTSMPISEIMENIGFKDHAHFSRTFKKYYTYSPMEQRKLHKFENLPADNPIYKTHEEFKEAKEKAKRKKSH